MDSKKSKILNRIKGEKRVQKSYKIFESLSKKFTEFANDNEVSENALINEIIREFLNEEDISKNSNKGNTESNTNKTDKENCKSKSNSITKKVDKDISKKILKVGDIDFKIIESFEYRNKVYYKLLDTNNNKVCKIFDNEKEAFEDIKINTFTTQKSNHKKEMLISKSEC